MTTPRSRAEEAQDPNTSPERLLEITQRHPQLHGLVVRNPSCPEVARQWILATNPWAKDSFDAESDTAPTRTVPADSTESDDEVATREAATGASTAALPPLADATPTSATPAAASPTEDDPYATSVWGDFADAGGSEGGASSPAQPGPAAGRTGESPTVRLAAGSSAVPLGQTSPVTPAPVPAQQAQPGSQPPPPQSQPQPQNPWGPAAAAGVAGGAASGPGPLEVGTGGGTAPPDEDPPDRRRAWFACGGCLVLALILLVVAGLVGRAWLTEDSGDYDRSTASPTTSEEPSETAEPTEEETTEEEPVSPAPEDAQELETISSPTGNISCRLGEDSVGCSLGEEHYSDAGLEDCGDESFAIAVAAGSPVRNCGQTYGGSSPQTLEYGQSAVNGDVACTSRSDGMTCWNTKTGKGFMVSRSTYETF
ncbi:hypothetical protein [Brachybacterium sp. GCM10030252]|uniref:variant leucine-rich repeat-containing protein n=1 Tax=Brachybacterium sp. GCM10030252 TaxID=3273380 RepID=UPI00360C141C